MNRPETPKYQGGSLYPQFGANNASLNKARFTDDDYCGTKPKPSPWPGSGQVFSTDNDGYCGTKPRPFPWPWPTFNPSNPTQGLIR